MSLNFSNLDISRTLIFLTGFSGSGKSTLAFALKEKLPNSRVIEGDQLRQIYAHDLVHGKEGLQTNTERLIDFSLNHSQSEKYIISAFVAPDANLRKKVKEAVNEYGIRFIEVYINTDIETCSKRDPKGLYARQRSGEDIKLAGLNTPYDIPTEPDYICKTTDYTVQELVQQLLDVIHKQ